MNQPIQIYNNIGCEFILDNNNFIIGTALKGYNTLDNNHVGSYIPYLVRNISRDQIIAWEIGVGFVEKADSKIIVSRHNVIQSYGSIESPGQKNFYLFANADGYNSGFNNVVVATSDFFAGTSRACYLIEKNGITKVKLIDPAKAKSVELQFKIISSDENSVVEISDDHSFRYVLKYNQKYLSIVSDGSKWRILLSPSSNSSNMLSALSASSDFSILGDPAGDDGSFQYKVGTSFSGGPVYLGSDDKILFGPDSIESNAKSIIPTSGNYDTIINNTKNKSDFIVHGSGVPDGYLPKNLIFTYDGKLGLNLPSGAKPQTALHIINNSCRESIRIENLSDCPTHIPNVTLYHKPSGVSDDTIISKVVFASRDSNNNKKDYAVLQTTAQKVDPSDATGKFDLILASGYQSVNTLSSDPLSTVLGYLSDYYLVANSTSGIRMIAPRSNNQIFVSDSLAGMSGGIVSVSGGSAVNITSTGTINLNQAVIINGINIGMPYIEQNKVLAVNSQGLLAPATNFTINGVGSNKLLTTDASGVVTGAYSDDSFLLTDGDITWSKFPPRLGNVCLRQITPIEDFPVNEFAVGDQLAIVTGVAPNQGTIYRNITSIDRTDDLISYILLDQNVTTIDSTIFCYSITKGGVLTIQVRTEDGTESQATATILSTRPDTNTVFNTKQKNINFTVYGIEDTPALHIMAKATTVPVNSGVYNKFATIDEPFASIPNPLGVGIGTSHNSVNFANIPSDLWLNKVTSVGTNGKPSFYGTYDQNGNVYEWVEDTNPASISINQNVCGGSWKTLTAEGLRSVISTPANLALEDVGFRICSRYGYSDDAISPTIGLSFVAVSNLDNIEDNSFIYTESYSNRDELNLPPVPSSIINLGKVQHPYRISTYEITNAQYIKFLNSVNKTAIFDLYNDNMSSAIVGGILRSGSDGDYVYTTKTNMGDKPVVYVNYLSAIRFINWLHNGAPDSENFELEDIEDGAYTIVSNPYGTTVYKNRDQKYWLPNLNEWHKAAYFTPVVSDAEADASAIMIRRELPVEISSGNLASFNVGGGIYADELVIGTNNDSVGSLLSTLDENGSGITSINYGYNNYMLNIGPSGAIALDSETEDWDGEHSTFISPYPTEGIQLATSGTIKLISPECVKISGLCSDHLFTKNITYIDPDTGDPIEGGQFPGPNGGFIYKDVTTDLPLASNLLSYVEADNVTGIVLAGSEPNNAIYANNLGILSSYEFVRFGATVEGLDGEVVAIGNVEATPGETDGEGNEQPSIPLVVESIRIGPPLPAFSGSILTHNGTDLAVWQPANYMRADGMSWNRYERRAVEILSGNVLRFSSLSQSDGGTGAVTREAIEQEFGLNDTIAIYNQQREVEYVKIAAIVPVGQNDEDISIFSNEEALEIIVCPSLPDAFIDNSLVPNSDPSVYIGYAFSVDKGAHLDMSIEPSATSRFSCETDADLENSPYGFKPSTINTISIRPGTDTSFNKLGEDIDFAIYNYVQTLNDRYEEELFASNSRGNPSGLIPALYIDSFIDSSFIGTIGSGVFADNKRLFASGIIPDPSAKITINTKQPHIVTSLSGVKTGLIYPNSVLPTGKLVSSEQDIATYADLTINGYTYSSGIISTEIVLKNTENREYIPNAPLTINSLGQIVSIVPPPQPTISDPPTNVSGFAANSSVRLQWNQPENTGNTPIIDYVIEYSENGEIWEVFEHDPSVDTSILVTGLQNAIDYKFRIYTVNEIGTSVPSEASDAIKPTANAPTQPTNLTIINRSESQIIVDWAIPQYQGPTGQSVVNYIVEYASSVSPPGPLTWTTWPEFIGTTTNVTLTNLSSGPTYYIRVRAQNSITSGAYASIFSVGSDNDINQPVAPEPEPEEDWDFGEIAFTGVCL
jgi:hypothetical protein